jgi:tRNA threonylcarbamoyladenosine biosynthesis protein TsaB
VVILTLDTTTRAGSSALWLGDRVIAEQVGDPERSHAERLPNDLSRLLAHNRLAIKDVTLYAIASGPGSFTGLRVGISTMQSLALVYDRLIVPISALEALAYCGARDAPQIARRGAHIIAWMEAFRGEVFSSLFIVRRGPDEFPKDPNDPFRHRQPLAMLEDIAPPVVGPPDVIAEKWARMIGEPAASESVIVIGDGVPSTTSVVKEAFPQATLSDAVPIAGMLARLAAREPERGVLPHAVMPLYVRPPDAQLARDRLQQQRGNVGSWSIG